MDFTLLLQRKWKLVIRQWHLHHYFRPDTVKHSCSSSKIKNKKNSFSICICRVLSNFLLQKMTTVTYLPNGCKDAMNMLNSPQLNRFTSKRIQVIFSYNCSQSKDGFLGAYAIHFISSIQTPDSDGTVA